MIKKILLSSGVFAASVALTSGMALAAGSISNTGKKSVNTITTTNSSSCVSENNNSTGITTWTGQQSKSGSAKVSSNTTGGSATSGDTKNTNTTGVTLTLTNSDGCVGPTVGLDVDSGDGSIDTTGPKSVNVITTSNISSVTMVNNNSTWVTTGTLQNAQSGDASVSGNTTGGSATSGGATNSNSTTVSLSISN